MFYRVITTVAAISIAAPLFSQTAQPDTSLNSAIAGQIERSSAVAAQGNSSGAIEVQSADSIVALQEALRYFGFLDDAADGAFGPATEAAIAAFQRYKGYDVTGKILPQQSEVLFAAHAKARREGALTNRRIITHSDGVAGLLEIYQKQTDEQEAQLAAALAAKLAADKKKAEEKAAMLEARLKVPPKRVTLQVDAPQMANFSVDPTKISRQVSETVQQEILSRLGEITNLSAELPSADNKVWTRPASEVEPVATEVDGISE